jgi:DNA-binding NtrC family response regulator
MKKRILVVDDDAGFRRELAEALEGVYAVRTADSVQSFRDAYRPYAFDLVILDMRLEREREGLDLVRFILANDPLQPIMVATAYPDTESYIEAINAGALMFLNKKDFSPALLARMVEAILTQGALQKRVAALEKRLDQLGAADIVGMSRSIRDTKAKIQQAALDGEVTVLVRGESGTGKELVAQNIHDLSPRRGKGPFISMSVAGLHRESLHSDLFGHEKGAFTGAQAMRKGFLEEAHGGTLFLDEIGDLDPDSQIKLLRVLETRTFQHLGGNRDISVDIQVVTATHQDLEQLVAAGRFRADLYYRLRAFEIVVPPLRERRDDIPLLAQHFLNEMLKRGRTTARAVSREVLDLLLGHAWPGNVRELRNVVEYAAIQARTDGATTLMPVHLPAPLPQTQAAPAVGAGDTLDFQEALGRAELDLVARAMASAGTAKKSELAQMLHYNDRFTFVRRLKRIVQRYPHLASLYPSVAALAAGRGDDTATRTSAGK